MVNIDEKLRAAGFRSTSVGHGQSSRGIGDALVVLSGFIRDVSSGISLESLSVARLERGTTFRSSSSSTWTIWVLGVRATELVHEVWNDTVKMDSIIITTVGQIDKVSTGGHKLEK